MKMSKRDRWFDYVIVGAGPSALGLVLGLLERCEADGSDGGGGKHKLPSIAVIERGGRVSDSAKTRDLSQWYPIAHQPNSSHTRLIGTSIVGRVLDLPIGQGLGGGSIINAGLIAPPPQEDYAKWPEPWSTLLPVAVENIWQRLDKMHLLQPLVGSDISPGLSQGLGN
jgi:choline dehydrogenase-like flavoprotein